MTQNMKWRSSPSQTQLRDEDYVALYRERSDLNLIASLFDRYVELIFGVCLKYLRDPAESEDTTMEIFEVLRDKLLTQEIANFKSWLYVVARNHCLQKLRKQARSLLTEDYDDSVVQLADTGHHEGELDLIAKENGLMDCLDKLPQAQKRSIELFYFQSKSYQEIAYLMTLDKEQVRSHLQNGKRNLRICMDNKELKLNQNDF